MEACETRKRPYASIAHDVHCNEPRNTNKRRNTVEFKALDNCAGCKVAKLQTCHNGVAVCEYMARLYKRAGIVPDAVDTCHWSLTCDTKTIELFVHWRVEVDGEVQYHMRRISTAALEGGEDEVENDKVVKTRKRLRNLLEHARGQRLDRVKFALSRIALPTPRSSSPRKRAATSQVSGSLGDEVIGASITSSALVSGAWRGQAAWLYIDSDLILA